MCSGVICMGIGRGGLLLDIIFIVVGFVRMKK